MRGVKFAPTEVFSFAAMVLALGFVGVVVVSIFAPYEPLSYDYVRPQETEVCPGGAVPVNVSYAIDPRAHDSIREIDITSYWIAKEVPGVREGSKKAGGSATLYPSDVRPGKVEEAGAAIREAPVSPGVWTLANDYRVIGDRTVWPPVQDLTVVSDKDTTVLPENHPRCEGN